MTNIGQKAMKKTLERLKENSKDSILPYFQYCSKTLKFLGNEKILDSKSTTILTLITQSTTTISNLMLYIGTLQDYCNESDEEWSRISKIADDIKKKQEQTKQKQTESQKGDTKKTGKYVA